MVIKIAKTDAEILACYPVMKELRPHITRGSEFLKRVRRQMGQGYRLAYALKNGKPVACMGYGDIEKLYTGPGVFVDDLATLSSQRSTGCGKALIQWLVKDCKKRGRQVIHLDSGSHRFEAHRFYFRERFHINSFHFVRDLGFRA
jgi:GNAT superfamily N-acetyltransferase